MSIKVTWLGHAAFLITDGKYNIIIDPYLSNNPSAAIKTGDLPEIHAILITHGHRDHIGDAAEIASKHNSLVVSTVEVVNFLKKQGVSNVHGQQPGGAFKHFFGKVKLTRAIHGSSLPDGTYGGIASGILLTINEKTLYHAGDTALFEDMKLIGKSQIDVALLPIGDNYTMGVKDAAKAVSFLSPKICIPMHYGTWDIINTDPEDFVAALKPEFKETAKIISPGESFEV